LKALAKPIITKPIETKSKAFITPKVTTKVEEKKASNLKTLPKKPENKTTTSKAKLPTTKPVGVKKTTVTTVTKPLEEKKVQEPKPAEMKPESPKASNNENANKRFGIHDKIYEIHGNVKYMRCDKDCTTDLFPSPNVDCDDEFVPECPNCKGVARY